MLAAMAVEQRSSLRLSQCVEATWPALACRRTVALQRAATVLEAAGFITNTDHALANDGCQISVQTEHFADGAMIGHSSRGSASQRPGAVRH